MNAGTDGSDQFAVVRAKLLKVYRYLEALNQIRNPVQRDITDQPWTLWFHDLPTHETVKIGRVASSADPGNTDGDDFILKVRRPDVTYPPEPPIEIQPWLEPGWQDPSGTIKTKQERKVTPPEGEPFMERFEDQAERVVLFNRWQARWEGWAEVERPARAALSMFDRLYDLQARLDREGERLELLVGDGTLNWQPKGQPGVNHPILLQRLKLEFDPEVPEFTLTETEQPPELYTALLRSIPDVEARSIKHAREDLDGNGWHPLGSEETEGFFRRVVSLLSSHGQYTRERPPRREPGAPAVWRDPVLFLRSRTLGFASALESILEDISTREEFPPSLVRIVGIDTKGSADSPHGSVPSLYDNPNGEDETVLLSKPANLEQLEIARRLERHGAVLVQGPPGTGKTHTIANLLGHLLAQGKSVLVTSHTAKALRVLRDKVVEPLQPLCVSVVDDTTQQLEAAVDGIAERLTLDPDLLDRQARGFTAGRLDLLRQLREARQKLKQAREDEYRDVTVAGQGFTPADAARFVANGLGQLDWIPTPVVPGEPLPLSAGELVELYRSNDVVSTEDERELALVLPPINDLATPNEVEEMVSERNRLKSENLGYRRDLWSSVHAPSSEVDLLHLQKALASAVEPLGAGEPWRLAAIEAGREGGPVLTAWSELIAEIEAVVNRVAEAQPSMLKYGPTIPADCLPDRIERVLDEIVEHVNKGGRLGMMQYLLHRDWKTVVEKCCVRGKAPETAEHFAVLRTLARLTAARAELLDRWDRQMASLGAAPAGTLGSEPERACRQFVQPIRTCMAWHGEVWMPLEQKLTSQGCRWSTLLGEMPADLSAYGDLKRLRAAAVDHLPMVMSAEIHRRRLQQNEAWRLNQIRRLELSIGSDGQAEVLQRLHRAVTNLNVGEYRDAFQRLTDLHARRSMLTTRTELLRRLESVAPGWAVAIRDRQGIHGERECPPRPADAWVWRQLNDELDRRAATSMEELQVRTRELSEQLHQLTAKLVESRSWASQVRRTNREQQQALQGWKLSVKRAGKGTGKRAPRLLAEARRLMPICQSAVPVWIMPLSRVAENFDPRRNRFDVVIVDEASQSDVMALVALYLGKQVVVVGDDEQVSPSAVGQDLDEVHKLIDEHLVGIPNHVHYDGQFSVYDLALTSFQPVSLREHFRCVSPIIQYSNHLSYDGKITPLRDASEVVRRPHTVAYRVPETDGSISQPELEGFTVASLVVAMTEQPAYATATVGVIGLVGDEQAMRIDTLLRRFMSTTAYAHHKVQCGNPANFQGDERDVMFLSMVDHNEGNGPLPLRTEGAGGMFKKRFNVAASRARDQMWVVHSLNPEVDLKAEDIRLGLIKHAENPAAIQNLMEQEKKRVESEFERLVLAKLIGAGYRVKTQWPVGAYRIDMVVEGAGKRLAVECDGDRYHTMDNLAEDMARQAILERLGWRFVRIRGSQFFRNPDAAMQPVFERLEKLGIPPEAADGGEASSDEQAEELQERIIRRAAELRREWLEARLDPVVMAPSRSGRSGRRTAPVRNDREEESTVRPAATVKHEDEVPAQTERTAPEPMAVLKSVPPKVVPPSDVPKKVPPERPPDSKAVIVQQTLFPEIHQGESDLVLFLQQVGVEFVDKRSNGGALWIVGGSELQPIVEKLRTIGVEFSFAPQGGKATKHRGAWFTRSTR